MATLKKIYTGIGLDPETIQFLADLGRQTERTRSWLINAIVLEKARIMRQERAARAEEMERTETPTILI